MTETNKAAGLGAEVTEIITRFAAGGDRGKAEAECRRLAIAEDWPLIAAMLDAAEEGRSSFLPEAQPKAEPPKPELPLVDLGQLMLDAGVAKGVVEAYRQHVGRPKPEPAEPEPEPDPEPQRAEPPEEPEPERFDEAAAAPLDPHKALVPVVGRTWLAEINFPETVSGADCVELLNQKHAVIGNYGGKTAVLSWERWSVNQKVLVPTFQKFEDFKKRYMNQYVQMTTLTSVKIMPAGEYWLKTPERGRAFDGVVYEPGKGEIVQGYRLNIWRDFAVTPRRGSWAKFRKHIYQVLGNGDEAAGRYIVRWCAWAIQNPGRAAEAVLVLLGDEGAGKGTLARVMLRIFGIHGLPVSDGKHLTGAFSGHLQFCSFLFLDEAFWAGDSAHEGRLKALVTEETVTIEPKYFAPFTVKNCLHIMISTNNSHAVPAGPRARRYSVLEVNNDKVGDFEYFNALNAELDNGGIEAFLWDMLHLDLRGWHPKQIYKSAALMSQKRQTLRGLDAWMEAILQDGKLPVPLNKRYPNRCLSENLLASAQKYDKYTNDNRMTDYLKRYMAVETFNIKTARGWAFPELSECRARWEVRFDGEWPWYSPIPDWLSPKVE
jgi:hypothetical protein